MSNCARAQRSSHPQRKPILGFTFIVRQGNKILPLEKGTGDRPYTFAFYGRVDDF
jgi:hypothetical protein